MTPRDFIQRKRDQFWRWRSGLHSPHHLRIPNRWLSRPNLLVGSEVCLFVTYAPRNHLTEHSVILARAWAAAGFQVVVVIVTDDMSTPIDIADLGFANGILRRKNAGYDFGAWASAISLLPAIRESSLLVTTNDSIYGPLEGFSKMLARVRATEADVVGAIESLEVQPHFQSFVLFFKPKALRSLIFKTFWNSVRTFDRAQVVIWYECNLVMQFKQAGLRCAALFPAQSAENPTLSSWRELIVRGFPFVKVSLLRDNPLGVNIGGWEKILASRGYDPSVVARHLAGF